MTDTTVPTVGKEWDIGKILAAHRRIVRAADAYSKGEIRWENYRLIADQLGGCYLAASLARIMPGVWLLSHPRNASRNPKV